MEANTSKNYGGVHLVWNNQGYDRSGQRIQQQTEFGVHEVATD